MKHVLILCLLLGFSTQSLAYKYNKDDCIWHIDGANKINIFEVVDTWDKDDKWYITKILDYKFLYDTTAYHMMSADYVDKYHPSVSHEDKCKKGLIKSAQEECLNNPNYTFTTGYMICPKTHEEYSEAINKWVEEKR